MCQFFAYSRHLCIRNTHQPSKNEPPGGGTEGLKDGGIWARFGRRRSGVDSTGRITPPKGGLIRPWQSQSSRPQGARRRTRSLVCLSRLPETWSPWRELGGGVRCQCRARLVLCLRIAASPRPGTPSDHASSEAANEFDPVLPVPVQVRLHTGLCGTSNSFFTLALPAGPLCCDDLNRCPHLSTRASVNLLTIR